MSVFLRPGLSLFTRASPADPKMLRSRFRDNFKQIFGVKLKLEVYKTLNEFVVYGTTLRALCSIGKPRRAKALMPLVGALPRRSFSLIYNSMRATKILDQAEVARSCLSCINKTNDSRLDAGMTSEKILSFHATDETVGWILAISNDGRWWWYARKQSIRCLHLKSFD